MPSSRAIVDAKVSVGSMGLVVAVMFPASGGYLQKTEWRRPLRPTACQEKAESFHACSSMLGEVMAHLSTQSEHPTWYSREGDLSANDGVEHAPRCAHAPCVCAPNPAVEHEQWPHHVQSWSGVPSAACANC